MWLLFLALSLSALIPLAVSVQLTWQTYALSTLFSVVFLITIYKDSKKPNVHYTWAIVSMILAMWLGRVVKVQSSFIFGFIYTFALGLAVYSIWRRYIASSNEN